MKKIAIQYEAGESAYTPGKAVDYMIAIEADGHRTNCGSFEWEGRKVSLYAECPPDETDECGTEAALMEAILAQAEEQGIPKDALDFR